MLQIGSLKPIRATVGVPRSVFAGSVEFKGDWRWPGEFIFQYFVERMGKEWWFAQRRLPAGRRHILVEWGEEAVARSSGEPFTSGMLTLANLGYNLFVSENHGLEIDSILKRLRAPANCLGAAYELHVRALFLCRGFRIVLENEADVNSKHCEFDAYHDENGIAVSVEVKTTSRPGRYGAPGEPISLSSFAPRIKHKLHSALKKPAKHNRVVFIELQMPASPQPERAPHGFSAYEGPAPPWKSELSRELESVIVDGIKGEPAPPFLVSFSNMPFHLGEDDQDISYSHYRVVRYPGWSQHKLSDLDRGHRTSIPISDMPLFMVLAHAGQRLETPMYFNPFEGIPGDDAPDFFDFYERRWHAVTAAIPTTPPPGFDDDASLGT